MPQRLQLRRTKDWRLPPNAASVARPGRFGNPFALAPHLAPGTPIGERYVAAQSIEDAVARFRVWLLEDEEGSQVLEEARAALPGKDLACWCPLEAPCHADVLLELVNDPAALPDT